LYAGLELARTVCPDAEREDDHRRYGRHHERDEELAIEARSHLAEQRAAARRGLRREPAEERGANGQHHVQNARQGNELADVDEVSEPGQEWIAERVDPAPIVEEVHPEVLAVARHRSPERLARG